MNIYLLIPLCIVAIALAWWLSTIRLITPTSGQLMGIAWFEEITTVVGNGIPKDPISFKDLDGNPLKLRIDKESTSSLLIIWPQKLFVFDYRYKKFKTLKEIRETGGQLRWQPTAEKDENGKLIPNSPETIALGEWKEVNKKTLFSKERDDIKLPFQSKDGIQGVGKGYIKYRVWEYSLAVSTMHDIKTDPEKAIADLYRNWASTKDYIKDIKGATFEDIDNYKEFLINLNKEIYTSGTIVEGIYVEEFFIEPGSRDVLEKQEEARKAELDQLTQAEKNKVLVLQASGDAAAKTILANNQAANSKVIAEADGENKKTIGMKENEVKVDLQRKLNDAEVALIQSETDIQLEAAKKVIDKMIEYKGKEDTTAVNRIKELPRLKENATFVYVEGNSSDNLEQFDDELVKQTVANLITKKKTVKP